MRYLLRWVACCTATVFFSTAALAQDSTGDGEIIPLYAAGAVSSLGVPEIRMNQPGSGDTMFLNVSDPTLELFRPAPDKANGTAMIIAPGGGFVGVEYDAGGRDVAHELVRHGVTALVLKYRTIESPPDPTQLPDAHLKEMDIIMQRIKTGQPEEVPPFSGESNAVEDGRRAMTIVRQRAIEWGVDPQRVGMIGFSAGAFLAADLAIGDKATRPDFVTLLYGGSRTPVPADAPPAFIAAAADDDFMPNDSIQLYSAWRKAGAPAELHIYEHGGHGFSLTPKGATSDHWFDHLVSWMQSRNLLTPSGSVAK